MGPKAAPQSRSEQVRNDIDFGFNALICWNHAYTPFLHSKNGTHYYIGGVWTIPMMVCYAAFMPCPELYSYIPVWLCLVASRQFGADQTEDSRFGGYAWLTGKFTRSELTARKLEVGLVFVVGLLLCGVSQGIGVFVMFGSLSLAMVLSMEMGFIRRQQIAMKDARLAAQRMARMQKGGNGFD